MSICTQVMRALGFDLTEGESVVGGQLFIRPHRVYPGESPGNVCAVEEALLGIHTLSAIEAAQP